MFGRLKTFSGNLHDIILSFVPRFRFLLLFLFLIGVLFCCSCSVLVYSRTYSRRIPKLYQSILLEFDVDVNVTVVVNVVAVVLLNSDCFFFYVFDVCRWCMLRANLWNL